MRGAPGLCERRAGWTTDSNHRILPAEPPMNGPLPPRSRGRSATTAGATDGLGDYQGSDVMLNDFVLIGEFEDSTKIPPSGSPSCTLSATKRRLASSPCY